MILGRGKDDPFRGRPQHKEEGRKVAQLMQVSPILCAELPGRTQEES